MISCTIVILLSQLVVIPSQALLLSYAVDKILGYSYNGEHELTMNKEMYKSYQPTTPETAASNVAWHRFILQYKRFTVDCFILTRYAKDEKIQAVDPATNNILLNEEQQGEAMKSYFNDAMNYFRHIYGMAKALQEAEKANAGSSGRAPPPFTTSLDKGQWGSTQAAFSCDRLHLPYWVHLFSKMTTPYYQSGVTGIKNQLRASGAATGKVASQVGGATVTAAQVGFQGAKAIGDSYAAASNMFRKVRGSFSGNTGSIPETAPVT